MKGKVMMLLPIKYWALRDAHWGYFLEMGALGPRFTRHCGEAKRFPTKWEAMQSPAYRHILANFKPEAIR